MSAITKFRRRAGVLGLAVLCSAATAASSEAAGLKVSVPSRVHKGAGYTITVTGHYRHGELSGSAFLISLIQFTAAPCKASAQLENSQLSGSLIQFYFESARAPRRVGIFEKSSPFSRLDALTAARVGSRRVCSYLYPKFIRATDTTAPIATASRAYTVSRH